MSACFRGVRRRPSPGQAMALAAACGALTACMPPSVQAVDRFLDGLAAEDPEGAAAWVVPKDREGVRTGLALRRSDPTALEALILPPTPLSHYFVEITKKSPDGRRHVLLTELTLENPLPAVSERVGQSLDGIPKTRVLTRRFLSVRQSPERWAVQLDLPAAQTRAEFVTRFEDLLDAGNFSKAKALLQRVPPPPDNGRRQPPVDRLEASLKARLDEARTRTATRAAPPSARPGAGPSGVIP